MRDTEDVFSVCCKPSERAVAVHETHVHGESGARWRSYSFHHSWTKHFATLAAHSTIVGVGTSVLRPLAVR